MIKRLVSLGLLGLALPSSLGPPSQAFETFLCIAHISYTVCFSLPIHSDEMKYKYLRGWLSVDDVSDV